jgi:hypothetical protein
VYIYFLLLIKLDKCGALTSAKSASAISRKKSLFEIYEIQSHKGFVSNAWAYNWGAEDTLQSHVSEAQLALSLRARSPIFW